MNKAEIEQYWQTLPADTDVNPAYLVDQFGDNADLANELGQLVLAGIKTATCSALWEWEAEQSSPPTVGVNTIVLDGEQHPICIIETTAVEIRPFNEVDASMAYDEGEGDRTLAYWRQEHWNYFSRVLPKIGKQPTPTMLLVCEHFQVVYRSPS